MLDTQFARSFHAE